MSFQPLNLAISTISAFNTITTTPITVAPANPSRKRILFHNPGSVDIFVAPTQVQVSGANVPLSPTTLLLGGCFRVYANGADRLIEGNAAGLTFVAFSASGSGNPLTVMELS
jgi:hypothetical protein